MTRLDNVECKVDRDIIKYVAVLCEQEGSLAKGRKNRTLAVDITFRMPGLTFVRIGSWIQIVMLDTPIDAGSTWRFMRRVSPLGNPLGLGRFFSLLASFDRFVQFREDLPIMQSRSYPDPASFSDVYVRADIGAIQYQRMRNRFLNSAEATADSYPRLSTIA